MQILEQSFFSFLRIVLNDLKKQITHVLMV